MLRWFIVPTLLILLAACGDDEEATPESTPTPEALAAASPTPSPTPTPTPTPMSPSPAVRDLTPTPVAVVEPPPTPIPTPTTFQLLEAVRQATVELVTEIGKGSGVIFDQRGYVLTADHVIQGAPSVTVVHIDGTEERGLILGRDEIRDVAIIKISGSPDLPTIKLGIAEEVRLGDKVLAIGFTPFNQSMSITNGIVSAFLPNEVEEYRLIQTDAPFYPGASGGALLNLQGEVVGIIQSSPGRGSGAIFQPLDAGYALALDQQVMTLLARLQAGELILETLGPGLGQSRDNPAPINWPVRVVTQDFFGDNFVHEITLTQVIRGQEAFQLLQQRSQFNTAPRAGMEYVLALVRIRYAKGPPGEIDWLHQVDFDAISNQGFVYDIPFWLVPMEPFLSQRLYPGAVFDGWTTWEVAIDDRAPLLAFGLNSFRGEGWFSLTPEEPGAQQEGVEAQASGSTESQSST